MELQNETEAKRDRSIMSSMLLLLLRVCDKDIRGQDLLFCVCGRARAVYGLLAHYTVGLNFKGKHSFPKSMFSM